MTGHAAAQGEESAQPLEPHARELFHVIETVAHAQKRAQGDDEQLDQIMFAGARDARVGHLAEDGDQADDFDFGNAAIRTQRGIIVKKENASNAF